MSAIKIHLPDEELEAVQRYAAEPIIYWGCRS